MKKQVNIYLVRHGESQLNAREAGSEHIPDHALSLTDTGVFQANECAEALFDYLSKNHNYPNYNKQNYKIWSSPYKRARETATIIKHKLELVDDQFREDDMLVEIDFGLFDRLTEEEKQTLYTEELAKFNRDRQEKGKFYARRPNGESGLDVEQRVRIFFDTIYRDINKDKATTTNLIIVCHGGLINIFLKAFFHKSHEWYYEQKNPGNCSIQQIYNNKYLGYIYGSAEDR